MKHVPFGVFHIFYISHDMSGNITCTLRLFNVLSARSKVLVKYLDSHCICIEGQTSTGAHMGWGVWGEWLFFQGAGDHW